VASTEGATPSPRRVRTPTVLQMEAVECGAAALGSILAYHGRWVPLAELRCECGVTRDGSQASNVLKAARRYGLVAAGFKKSLEAAQRMPVPYMAFWNFVHFVVVEGFDDDRVYLNDPAYGPRTVTPAEFSQSFTGIALTFEPGPDFRPGGQKPHLSKAVAERLRRSVSAVVFCILAGLLLAVPGLAIAALTQAFVDNVLVRGSSDWLRPIALGLLVAAALQAVLLALQLRGLRRLELKLGTVASSRFLWHVLRLPASFYAQRFAGEVSGRVGLNDRVAGVLSGKLATGTVSLVSALAYGVVMFRYDAGLTMVVLASVLTCLLALRLMSRRRVDATQRLEQTQGMADGYSIAGLLSLETIKASALEGDFFAKWSGYFAKAVGAQQQVAVTGQLLVIVPAFLSALTAVIVLVAGGRRVMDGTLSLGALVAYQSLMQSVLAPVTTIMGLGATLQELRADVSRLDDVLRNRAESGAEETAFTAASAIAEPLAGRVELRHVTFGYNHVGMPLLEDFSFVAEPGERIAIVGASGCGKTTVLKLLTGLYQPWAGEILFDGRPRSAVTRFALTNSVALVEQDPLLFAGTVRDNLTLWDDSVPHEKLVRACVDACVHDVVSALPGGYSARLDEGAHNLSGGQRQRLEIARAIVNDPTIVVMDEATSALDPESERLVLRNLRRRAVTTIAAAHRVSAIRDCDQILVLKAGRLVEQGTHRDLMTLAGEYARLIAVEGDAL